MRTPVALLCLALLVSLPLRAAGKDDATKDAAGGHVINDADATLTIDCSKDKSEVAINGSGNTITLTGACTKVAVNGSTNKVTIVSVEKLAVNGSRNVVSAAAAGKIAVTGSDNQVTFKAGLAGKKPKVANLGSGNTVKKAE